MSKENNRGFSLSANAGTKSGVLQIEVGNTILSVTTINGVNEMVVFSKDSNDTITERKAVTDFSDVIHMIWNLERL
jgi:hypothetical protein